MGKKITRGHRAYLHNLMKTKSYPKELIKKIETLTLVRFEISNQ